jgi:hypothetical protein
VIGFEIEVFIFLLPLLSPILVIELCDKLGIIVVEGVAILDKILLLIKVQLFE